MSDNAIPVKYVLFSHYHRQEENDLTEYQEDPRPERVATLPDVRYLLDHLRGLEELLTSPGHEGMMVIFYDPGYTHFLNTLARRRDEPGLEPIYGAPGLRFAAAVSEHVNERLRAAGLAERVRFLTSHDLAVILGLVNEISAENFRQFFVGRAKGLRYDAPKVVEAILRLRLIGMGIPVLRLDHDVIFRETNINTGDLGLFKAVACAVRAYRLRVEQPAISTFLFSASYDTRALFRDLPNTDRFEAWSRAFATRIYPALIADPAELNRICRRIPDSEKKAWWSQYVVNHVDDDLACRFYGLADISGGALATTGTNGIIGIGAHPLHAVISGALLCLSDGAILDLPPFSNFSNSVMWIDDHLKYSLHRAMHHFTSGETLDLEPGLSDARLDEVMVTKARPTVNKLPSYIFGQYLPTLLYGAIMDAWITVDPIVKCRIGTIAREGTAEAPLPRAMNAALKVGRLTANVEEELREGLAAEAAKRIEEVRVRWLPLRNERGRTFASYWAEGRVASHFDRACFPGDDQLWQGIPRADLGHDAKIAMLEDVAPHLKSRIDVLIDDTVDYVKWTLEWPRFVQIARSIRQGDFIGDIGWRPGKGREMAASVPS